MQYRLLRNNKESGPYTKAQLIEMGLKPFDLLWAEGRGGAWLYASEINDLKDIAPSVEEQPYDRFYKRDETNQTSQPAIQQPAPKAPKPRFRISGDKIEIVEAQQPAAEKIKAAETLAAKPLQTVSPAQATAAPATKPVQPDQPAQAVSPAANTAAKAVKSVGPDWEEMFNEWEKNGKYTAEEPVVETPKPKSLNDIKQQYAETVEKKKTEEQTKVATTTRQNIMAGVAIAVLAIGAFAGYKLNQHNDTVTGKPATTERAEIVQNGNGNDASSDDSNATGAAGSEDANSDNSPTGNEQSAKDNNPRAGRTPQQTPPREELNNSLNTPVTKTVVQQTLPSAKEPAAQQPLQVNNTKKPTTAPVTTKQSLPGANKPIADKNQQPIATNVVKKETEPATVTDKSSKPAQIDVATTPTVTTKKTPPKKKISDYVAVSRISSTPVTTFGVQNVHLSVANKTDIPIDLAVVDIQYYGSNGRLQRGETMYIKNIGAGGNVDVRVPDSRNSKSISYKVSLVSAEQKTLYLVGE